MRKFNIFKHYSLVGFNLITSISLARAPSSISRNTVVSVCQVTGFFPLPVAHSQRISVLIRSASSLCLKFKVANSSSIWVIQEVEAKMVVIGANLLWKVDCSLPSWESDAF